MPVLFCVFTGGAALKQPRLVMTDVGRKLDMATQAVTRTRRTPIAVLLVALIALMGGVFAFSATQAYAVNWYELSTSSSDGTAITFDGKARQGRLLEGANSDLNPLVYPYEKRCTNFINGIIEALTEDGSVLTDKEIQNIKNMTRNALISFASLDGKSKVSRKGFLDIAKSIEVLSQKVANNQDYDAPEIKDNFIDEVETTQRYSRSGGSGGCNSIGILGIYLLLAVMLILNPVFRLKK